MYTTLLVIQRFEKDYVHKGTRNETQGMHELSWPWNRMTILGKGNTMKGVVHKSISLSKMLTTF